MRILLMTWACDAEDVSEPEISARWVREISRDHEVTVFSVSKPERFGCVKAQFPDLDVIEWQDIRVPKSLERFRAIVKPGYLPYYFKARRFLKRLLATRRFDVIHHLSPFAWRYPSPAAGLGVPLVRGPVAGGLKTPEGLRASVEQGFHPFMFLRKSDQLRMKFDPFLRYSYRHTDHLLMAAPYMQDFLQPLPIGKHSIEIEHGYSDDSITQPPAVRPSGVNPVHFLYVGRIIRSKGLRYAIQALSDAANKDHAILTVVGDGDDIGHCKEMVTRLRLEEKVRFLGWKSKSEVEEFYRSADVFIFPSFREPTGGVLMEAMAHGLPSITCAYGGPDYLIDDSCGIKVTPSTEDAFVAQLAQATDRLIIDPVLKAEMSKNASLRIEQVFRWDSKRDRICDLYSSLVQR